VFIKAASCNDIVSNSFDFVVCSWVVHASTANLLGNCVDLSLLPRRSWQHFKVDLPEISKKSAVKTNPTLNEQCTLSSFNSNTFRFSLYWEWSNDRWVAYLAGVNALNSVKLCYCNLYPGCKIMHDPK
jgi:hypothetical protein